MKNAFTYSKIKVLPLTHYDNGDAMGEDSVHVKYPNEILEITLSNGDTLVCERPDGRKVAFGLGEEGTAFEFVQEHQPKQSELQKIKDQIAELEYQIHEIKQKVVKSFKENFTLPELSHTHGIKVLEALDILIEAHEENQIDFVTWIERNVSSKSLFKGVEYFTKIANPTIKEGRDILGLDESTLKLSQLYAREIAKRKADQL